MPLSLDALGGVKIAFNHIDKIELTYNSKTHIMRA